jgi:hypothetical protein
MTGDAKHLVINHNTSGDNALLPAKPHTRYVVQHFVIVSAGTVTVRFESGAGGTALTGVMPLVANSILQTAFSPVGYFMTLPNQTLNLELSAAIVVAGWLTYYEVESPA